MNRRVEKVSAENVDDFFKVHSGRCSWCYCTAWWTETWDGWSDRTDKQNLELRKSLFNGGEYDGYLLYVDDRPVGWCQVGRRDRLSKLVKQFDLQPDSGIWAITCLMIRPEFRREGHCRYLLKVILEEMKALGIKTVYAFPKRTDSSEEAQHWRGPEVLFLSCGFRLQREDSLSPILSIDLR